MRLNVSFHAVSSLVLCLAFAFCSKGAAAQDRYMGFEREGVMYRMDNQTGDIFQLIKQPAGPFVWVKCDVQEPKGPKQNPATYATLPPQPANYPSPNTVPQPASYAPQPATCVAPFLARQPVAAIIDPGAGSDVTHEQPAAKPAVTGTRQIQIFDDFGKNITDVIDDAARAMSKPLINSYEDLHVSHTLKTNGDRINGIIIVDNKGSKRINMLELTLFVKVRGRDNPIEHQRFVFADKPGCDAPPKPADGRSGMSLLKKVDVSTPSGVIDGMPEVRVTYIRFEE